MDNVNKSLTFFHTIDAKFIKQFKLKKNNWLVINKCKFEVGNAPNAAKHIFGTYCFSYFIFYYTEIQIQIY